MSATEVRASKPAAKPVTVRTVTHVSTRSAKKDRDAATGRFWHLVTSVSRSEESKRLSRIHVGFTAEDIYDILSTLRLGSNDLERLFYLSASTLERRLRSKTKLDTVASERVDRIAMIAKLSEDVFEDRNRATEWLSMPNIALGNAKPIDLCETEIGSNQVRRVLHAIEWGGVA
ncbi:DUF2384 domain-containing protein [Pseudomonas sp. MOB-449]|nr:DUF2384 domain-containing protein [Pseudomonas sp. MOB-449]